MKKISILGSTGFIGANTLKVISEFPDQYEVAGLAAGQNVSKLAEQIRTFKPQVVSVAKKEGAEKLKTLLPPDVSVPILFDQKGMVEVAAHTEADLVVSAMVGSAGLIPTMAAIEAGKQVALANKETLVVGGSLVIAAAQARGMKIIPIDSEHSAIFQVLQGHRREDVKRIILTASGGPFLNLNVNELSGVTPEQALKHPVWDMGKKITIDSATLMNKGLEVIEARWLFNLSSDSIAVVIHPQSIIHSMVEYCDGSVLAQMSLPDMSLPIAYALGYPRRLKIDFPSLDLAQVGRLTFAEPDHQRFPALQLAGRVLQEGDSLGAVLNGANEAAVEAFLLKQISFPEITEVIERTMDAHTSQKPTDVAEAMEINVWARQKAGEIIIEFSNDNSSDHVELNYPILKRKPYDILHMNGSDVVYLLMPDRFADG